MLVRVSTLLVRTMPAFLYRSLVSISTVFIARTTDLEFSLSGTGILIYGLAINSSFSVDLDGANSTTSLLPSNSVVNSGSEILASFTGLQQSDHLLTLTTHVHDENGLLMFERAVITASADTSKCVPCKFR